MVTSNHDIRKPSTAPQNGFGEKNSNTTINLVALVFGVGAVAIFFVPQHCISCCSDVFCATVLCFVPWPVSSCHNHFLFSTALCYVPWHWATCHGIVLRAMALFFVPRQCSLCRSKAVAFVASFFVLWWETTCYIVAQCSALPFLRASAKNDLLLHSAAGRVVPWHCSLCCGHISLCHGKKWCTKAFYAVFFILQQETKHSCDPWHCASCCGMVHHAVAFPPN